MGRESKARKERQKLRSEQAADAGRRPVEAADAESGAVPLEYEAAEAELVAQGGDHWDSAGNRNTQRIDNALVRKFLRWQTDATASEFEGREPTKLTAQEIAILITRRNMLSGELNHSNAAVRNLVAMVGQNQRDDLGDIEPPTDQTETIRADVDAMRQLAAQLNAYDSIIDAAYRIESPPKDTHQPGRNGHATLNGKLDGGPASPLPG